MESDGLESDEIVSGRDGRGDGASPRAVLSDHLTSGPITVVDCAGEETSFINLELEFEDKYLSTCD